MAMQLKQNFHQQGVGLIEVLVSLLILAAGLLGLAALQTHSLRFSHESYMRTQASILASDMIDRIRVNSNEALNSNSYNFALGAKATGSVTACETAACSPSQLAAYDYSQWSTLLSAQLAGGVGSVTPGAIANGSRPYTIVVQFNSVNRDSSLASGAVPTSSFTYRTRI